MRYDQCDGGCSWEDVRRVSNSHSVVECAVCGTEEIIPTPADIEDEAEDVFDNDGGSY